MILVSHFFYLFLISIIITRERVLESPNNANDYDSKNDLFISQTLFDILKILKKIFKISKKYTYIILYVCMEE